MNDLNELELTRALLAEVFGDIPTTSFPYLEWLYDNNPVGKQVERNFDDAHGRAGHYAVIPQVYADSRESWKICLSLNTAVSPRAQGQGLFVKLAKQVIDDAIARGIQGIIGVANSNSTPGFVRRLSFSLVRPLPTLLGITHGWATTSDLREGDGAIDAIAAMEAAQTSVMDAGPAQVWTRDMLHWRLKRPGTDYVTLANHEAGLVAARTHHRGVAFMVILGTFAARPVPINIAPLIAAASRRLNAMAFVYAGWNKHASLTGLPLPDRLKPSPLNLIWRPLGEDTNSFSPDRLRRFEFLDFDAY